VPIATVPSGIEDVTAQWLGEVLGTRVDEVRAEQIALDTGFSSRLYRLHVTGDEVPASVIVKAPADSEARGALEMMGGYTREVAFYREVAGRAPIGVPSVYCARMSDDSSNFILVLEDLQTWENADYLTGLTTERARSCMAGLAGLHAWSAEPANSGVVAGFPSVGAPVMRELLPSAFGLGWQTYRDDTDAIVPASVASFADRFSEHAPRALDVLTERTMLVHGDFRADNLFFAGDELKVVDFQFAARGAGALDIAYLLSQGLPTTMRTGRDRDLLAEYLGELAVRGVVDYSLEEAWRHYRFAVGYLMVLPVVALLGAANMPDRARRLCMTLIDRSIATFDDVNALEVFE
jgi:aminoglycoside phosphotransferase (APT) family kinase protein